MNLLNARQATSALILALMLVTACGGKKKGDTRLVGTWRSNQAQTFAAALSADAKLAQATPEEQAAFKSQFGNLSLTYTDSSIVVQHPNTTKTFNYEIVERGDDFIVIKTQGAIEDGRSIRMRFVDNNSGYWVETGLGYLEKFDKQGAAK